MSRDEPLRRRLTVGPGASMTAAASAEEGGAVDMDSSKAMAELLRRYAQTGRAYCVTSKSDRLENRKAEFAEKDQEVMCSDEQVSEDDIVRTVLKEYPIAWKCHKGKKPDAPNQDSFSICIADRDFGLYCVYDGHGPFGHDVSDRARSLLVNEFLSRKDRAESLKTAFEEAFTHTQSIFQDLAGANQPKESKLDANMSGTTVTMAYHDMRANKLWIAHVGDSRAVLGRRRAGAKPAVEDMTVDHKPDLEEERARIEKNGGRVIFDGYYNHRVFAKAGAYPGLNMSRALGDCVGHKEAGLTAMPDVKEVDLSAYEDEEVVLLLCTDGVWEFLSSEDAMMLIMASSRDDRNLSTSLGEVTKKSWNKWMDDSDNEVSDDITGIAVVLKKDPSQR